MTETDMVGACLPEIVYAYVYDITIYTWMNEEF